MLLGSVSLRAFAYATCPVVVVPAAPTMWTPRTSSRRRGRALLGREPMYRRRDATHVRSMLTLAPPTLIVVPFAVLDADTDALIVVDGCRLPLGIVTNHDLVRVLIEIHHDPEVASSVDVVRMRHPKTCRPCRR